MSNYQVRITEPDAAERVLALTGIVEVGRQAEIHLADPAASRRHLRLEAREDGVVAEDLQSSNGTVVNGWQMTHAVLLNPGDQLVIGDTVLTVEEAAPAGTAPPAQDLTGPATIAPTGAPITGQSPQPDPTMPAAAPVTGGQPLPAGMAPAGTPADAADTAPPSAIAALRPAVEALSSLDADGAATIRFRPGTVGEHAAKGMASSAKRVRRKLAGFGSEPWGTQPNICLVDPFPDPDTPGALVTTGSIVDGPRNEVWMVVTSESPPEPLERALTLLFGAALPAAAELETMLEGYGLFLAGAPSADDELGQLDLPPLHLAEGELRAAMALSFVRYLVEREGDDGIRRFLGTAQPGRADVTAEEVYGVGLTQLEMGWREKLASGGPKVKAGQFVRLSFRYIKPHKWKQVEIFVYMIFALAFTTAFPFVTRQLFDEALPNQSFPQVLQLLSVLGVAFVISLIAGLRQAYLTVYISGAVVRDIRKAMFGTLQTLSTGWYHRHQQGDVLTRLFSDVQVVEQGLTQTLRDGLFQMLTLVVSAIVMLTISPMMGVIVLVGAPLVAIVYRVMGKGAQKRGLAVQEETGALLGVAAENYNAEPVVKVFGLQMFENAKFGRISERLFRSERRLHLYGGLFGLSVNLIVTVLRLGVLGFGAWLIVNGNFTIGGLVAFLGIMGEVLSPVTVLTGIGQEVQAATGALHRIDEVLQQKPELEVPPDAVELPALSNEIRIADVSFSYTNERQVLDSVEAVIPAGLRVAFVGPSGSGKSTLLQLLMRLYDPESGSILFDGVDIRQASVESLRGQIGVVFQDNFLFDTTVRENIGFGLPNCTDAEIEAAAEAAGAHEFIMQLPRGYDTTVGERGGQLSGGQRQRVAIARALVRNPRLLLLDEATSALDPKTERQIIATLNRIAMGRTTVAITHRLTSVVDYDKIICIVDGKIHEVGTHDELPRLGGIYARLWQEQTGQAFDLLPQAFEPVPALARLPLFAELDEQTLQGIADRLVSVDLAPGQTVGDGDGNIALVAKGRGRVLTSNFNGDRVVVTELTVGDAFGMQALLSGTATTTLEAIETTQLLVLDDQTISAVALRFPSVAQLLEGRSDAAAAPQGGQRLSRVTYGARAGMFLDSSRLGQAALGSAEDVRRMTGVFVAPAIPPAGPSGSSGPTDEAPGR